MNQVGRQIAITLAVLLLHFCKSDMRIYVDPSLGSDSSEGSFGQPVATIQRAMSLSCAAQGANLTLFLRSGVYAGSYNTQIRPCSSIVEFRVQADVLSQPLVTANASLSHNASSNGAIFYLPQTLKLFSIVGVTFRNCIGPIVLSTENPVNTVFSDCHFNATVGSVFLSFFNSSLVIRNTVISNTVPVDTSSAVTMLFGTLFVESSSFLFNGNSSAAANGGAINMLGNSLTISNSTFVGNAAGLGGGAVSCGGSITISDSNVRECCRFRLCLCSCSILFQCFSLHDDPFSYCPAHSRDWTLFDLMRP